MATLITTFQEQVEIILGPDDATTELSESQIRTHVKTAVEKYSRSRHDVVTEDEAGDGGKYYAVSGLASWVEDFSRVLSIEYPAEAVSEDTHPVYLEEGDWNDDYWVGSTRYIFLPNHAPAATETMRFRYTAPYTWTGSGSSEQTTTPTQDFYAICQLAASFCCQSIAVKYSRTVDSAINADSVGHTSRAGEFSRRAKELLGLYEDHMGLGSDGASPPFVQGAAEFVDLDTSPTWPLGRRYLYHGNETR